MENKKETELADGLSPKTWSRLIPYVKRIKKPFIIVMVTLIISAVVEAAFPLFISYAINNFVTPMKSDGIWQFALIFGLVILFSGVTVVIFSRQSMVVEMRIGPMLKRDCFHHLQQLPLSYYNQNSVGYLLARVMSDTDRISGMVAWGLQHLLWNLVYVLGTIAFMFVLSWRLALILVLIIPIVAVISYFFQRKILVVGRRVRAINSEITGAYNEGISGAKVSKTLVIEDQNSDAFEGRTADMYRQSIRAQRLSAMMMPLVMFVGSVGVGAVLYRGGILVMENVFDFGILSAFISYAVGIIEPVLQAASILNDMVNAQVGIERVTALLDEPCTIVDTPEVIEKYGDAFEPKTENWEPIEGRITFENIWFKYPDGDEYILEDFSLDIPAGTTVAIVGETGAGKSTIVNLACRFFEPTRGKVLVDGRDYRERSQLWLHSSLGYVLQDPHLFSGTIMENIRYGRLDATEEEIIAAARLVSADTVAARMPEGYNAQVGEGGDRLSTGEKQLISFARAVIADPRIFVLDEATSSIDTETELLIQNAISHILQGRTSFIIAHRLSTISRSDLILVVEDGRIIERGTHTDLLRRGGHYAKLYRRMQIREQEDGWAAKE